MVVILVVCPSIFIALGSLLYCSPPRVTTFADRLLLCWHTRTNMATDDSKIVCVIADEDTVTGFLLAGIGQRDASGNNFLVVDAKTSRDTIEKTFTSFGSNKDVGLIIINQSSAEAIRGTVTAHTESTILPVVLEIPSKDAEYSIAKDPLMKRVMQMLGETF